jgi:hypothetical protein
VSQAGRHEPVVVLTYAYSGVARIRNLLSGSAVLALTSATGLLPLCAQAAATWRRIDNRGGPLSPLAACSIRALAGGMITAILAETGKPRWCEISFSQLEAAETFLQLYPGTRFICLHRGCRDVILAGARANPWGLAGTSLAPFTVAYPGNSAAAIAAYWAECTETLLRFQDAHPAASRQVRYEDLAAHPDTANPDQEARDILAFVDLDVDLGLDAVTAALTSENAAEGVEIGALAADAQVPGRALPVPLAERVNGLQARLGYSPIA